MSTRRENAAHRRLHNGRILDEAVRELVSRLLCRVRLAHVQILDVAATEYDVLEDFVARQNRSVGGTILGAERAHLGQGHGRLVRVYGVQDALITDLGFRHQTYFTSQVWSC